MGMRGTIRNESRAKFGIGRRLASVGGHDVSLSCVDAQCATFEDGFLNGDFVCAPVREAHLALLVRVIGVVTTTIVIIWHGYDSGLTGEVCPRFRHATE